MLSFSKLIRLVMILVFTRLLIGSILLMLNDQISHFVKTKSHHFNNFCNTDIKVGPVWS